MHETFLVRVSECRRNFTQEPNSLGDRKLADARQSIAQRLSLDERHGVIRQPCVSPVASSGTM
jgi:hypothetical protein